MMSADNGNNWAMMSYDDDLDIRRWRSQLACDFKPPIYEQN
jgi:hypothetical protein